MDDNDLCSEFARTMHSMAGATGPTYPLHVSQLLAASIPTAELGKQVLAKKVGEKKATRSLSGGKLTTADAANPRALLVKHPRMEACRMIE